jgi:arsenite methyltransferase
LGVCDGDFATATLSTGDLDPLEVCVNAFVEGFVNDRWLVRRMSRLAADAGFDVSPLRSFGLVETVKPGLTVTWVDRLIAGPTSSPVEVGSARTLPRR